MTASERMKRRWREHRDEMLRVLAEANAQAGKRNKTRWAQDRQRMTEIATRNAMKGTAALTGTHYTPERSRRASEGGRGKIMGGQMAKGPEHPFADSYSLCDPEGQIYRWRNIIEFVRSNEHLFDTADLSWKRGHCRASKGLSKLRLTNKRPAFVLSHVMNSGGLMTLLVALINMGAMSLGL